MLQCLFEVQDIVLCNELGEIFKRHELLLIPNSRLEYHDASHFLFVCKLTNCWYLKVNFPSLNDMRVEILDKYYTKLVTEMTSFVGRVYLSLKGVETLSKILSCQHNLLSLLLSGSVQVPACIKMMFDSIKFVSITMHNLTELASAKLSVQELDSVGSVISMLKSLGSSNLRGLLLDHVPNSNSSNSFCVALRDTICLKKTSFGGFRFSA